MVCLKHKTSDRLGHDLTESVRRAGHVPVMGSAGQNGFHDKSLANGPGIVIGRSGASFGQVHYSAIDFWPHNTALYVTDFKGNDPRFAFYLLKAIDFSRYNSGSAQPSLNRNFIYPIQVKIPPPHEQKAIALTLGALDDKLELNRRMNATLEEMAHALFNSWFVDFDPVRAKIDGRPLRDLDRPNYATFPAKFQESPIGPIPLDWEVKSLGELIELAYGKPLKAEARKAGLIRVYGSNGQIGWHSEKLVSGPGIVIGRKGNPGVVTWAPGDFFPIDTTFYVVPNKHCPSLYFLHYALTTHDLANLAADSAVPGLNRNHVYMSKQLVPSNSVLDAFDSLVSPIHSAIQVREEESRTLAALRDTLLPKLLSGEVRLDTLSQEFDVHS